MSSPTILKSRRKTCNNCHFQTKGGTGPLAVHICDKYGYVLTVLPGHAAERLEQCTEVILTHHTRRPNHAR